MEIKFECEFTFSANNRVVPFMEISFSTSNLTILMVSSKNNKHVPNNFEQKNQKIKQQKCASNK